MSITAPEQTAKVPAQSPDMAWLDLTRKCQLNCLHCYNDSGPRGGHGTMTRADWIRVLEELAALGTRHVQLIGGEPTLHPDAPELVTRALDLGLTAEVYSNLVAINRRWWELLRRERVSAATSYYSDQAGQHDAITGRASHARTRANIAKALRMGVPLRVGIVDCGESQRVEQARAELERMGVTRIRVDRSRPFGRASGEQEPCMSGLCGRCGTGRAAITPDGTVSPCVFSTWLTAGNVREAPLGTILSGPAMTGHNEAIRAEVGRGGNGDGDNGCDPGCDPESSCNPGYPGSECPPRGGFRP